MPQLKFFKKPLDFRKWLEKNHDKQDELWVGYYKKSTGKASIDWPQSVDQALCFGWIDGIRKNIDEESYKIRFTPRRKTSIWSAINITRVEELKALGLIQPAGLKVFQERKKEKSNLYSFENRHKGLDKAYEAILKANKKAWDFYKSKPPSYQHTSAWWVMSAKKEETRLKRLKTLIEDCENKRIISVMQVSRKEKQGQSC